MSARPRVVVLGGGFAGLETAYMLRMKLGEAVRITLVSDHDAFLFKPNTIYIPFGGEEDDLLIPLDRPLHRKAIDFVPGQVAEVDPDQRRVALTDGTVLPYDRLVIATGASMRPEEVPGLAEHAETIWTPEQMRGLGRRLSALVTAVREGGRQRVLFLVPPNNKCSGPLYEIVFMLETWLRRKGVRDAVDITYSTYEDTFIQAFGPRLHEVVTTEFTERGVEGHNAERVASVDDGTVHYDDGSTREYDLLIAFPPYIAAVTYPGLPADDRGFLTTELHTRQVVGHPDVYAPGDAGDFPVKQAFLAFLQADAAAEHLAYEVSGQAVEHPFEPVSMCVMEMFDKAAFAQVPLRLTGDPAHPIAVDDQHADLYKVGVSPVWRIGKKMLGVYLPMRFRAGEPFHAGNAWKMMDVGLKGMVGVLAE